jgi:hypothetical protein
MIASVRDSLQLARILSMSGDTQASKDAVMADAGDNNVNSRTAVEFKPGIATPVPRFRISSITESEESQKNRYDCGNLGATRSL